MSECEQKIGDRIWLFGRSPALYADPIAQAAAFVLLVSLLFLAFPDIDPWFTGLFYNPAAGFPMSHLGAFVAIRRIGDIMVKLVVVALIAALVIKLLRPARPAPIRPGDIVFLLTALVVGPGLVVNAILKSHWGRPRPSMTQLFGGDAPFVGVWQISDSCSGNCSFVSGEASAAAWLVAAAVIFPPRWRGIAFKLLAVLAIVLSLNRVAFGRHFLSDTLLAWGLTFLVVAVIHRIVVEHPPTWLKNEYLETQLARIGRKLRPGAAV